MQFFVGNSSDISLHPDGRWDAEYMCFAPYKNMNLQYIPIGEALLSSQYGLSIQMSEEGDGTKIYRMNEISDMMCERNVFKYAPIGKREIENYRLNDRDVLFNRTNSQVFVGRTGIFRKFSSEDFVFASYLVRLNPDPDVITPEYLTAFLNTKYGTLDVKRRARISINQSNVNAEELKLVEIPLLSKDIQLKITIAFDNAFELIRASEDTYQQAQALLLDELGLAEWRPVHRLAFIKNYSEVEAAERFDADYFQPKYDAIIEAVKTYSGGWDMLGNLVSVKKCIEVGSKEYLDEGVPFVRVSNLNPFEITKEKYISESLYSKLQQHQPAQGEILFSKDATPGVAYYLSDKPEKMLPSGGILRLMNKTDRINDEYLTLALNSVLTKEQVNRDVGGSVILHWRPEQVKAAVIPLLREEIQAEIQRRVVESFRLRKRSRRLLECAKRAVEIAIEEGEQVAVEWLASETENLAVAG